MRFDGHVLVARVIRRRPESYKSTASMLDRENETWAWSTTKHREDSMCLRCLHKRQCYDRRRSAGRPLQALTLYLPERDQCNERVSRMLVMPSGDCKILLSHTPMKNAQSEALSIWDTDNSIHVLTTTTFNNQLKACTSTILLVPTSHSLLHGELPWLVRRPLSSSVPSMSDLTSLNRVETVYG